MQRREDQRSLWVLEILFDKPHRPHAARDFTEYIRIPKPPGDGAVVFKCLLHEVREFEVGKTTDLPRPGPHSGAGSSYSAASDATGGQIDCTRIRRVLFCRYV